MLLSPEQLVQQIHDSPRRIVLAATGGGSRAIADLLEVPGGSRTLLEAVVPYSAPAMVAFLGGLPDEFCSAATARAMAMVAFQRARQYEEPGAMPAGVACTASLATDRPKRGPHRVHVALQTDVADGRLVAPIAEGSPQPGGRGAAGGPAAAERPGRGVRRFPAAEARSARRRAGGGVADRGPAGVARPSAGQGRERLHQPRPGSPPKIILPGAFNPLHAGHRRMAQIAQELLQQPVALEISIVNVDKPPLDYAEIERRLGQFPPDQTVYLTRAATFEEKSRLFPEATFLVGADTLRRIAAPQYYGGDPTACQCRHRTDRQPAAAGSWFSAARLGDGFVRLADLDLPDSLHVLCREVPPEVFREDVSSTAIRKSGAW